LVKKRSKTWKISSPAKRGYTTGWNLVGVVTGLS